jgi:hypothetical protein
LLSSLSEHGDGWSRVLGRPNENRVCIRVILFRSRPSGNVGFAAVASAGKSRPHTSKVLTSRGRSNRRRYHLLTAYAVGTPSKIEAPSVYCDHSRCQTAGPFGPLSPRGHKLERIILGQLGRLTGCVPVDPVQTAGVPFLGCSANSLLTGNITGNFPLAFCC